MTNRSNGVVSFLISGVRIVYFEHERFAVLITQLTSCTIINRSINSNLLQRHNYTLHEKNIQ